MIKHTQKSASAFRFDPNWPLNAPPNCRVLDFGKRTGLEFAGCKSYNKFNNSCNRSVIAYVPSTQLTCSQVTREVPAGVWDLRRALLQCERLHSLGEHSAPILTNPSKTWYIIWKLLAARSSHGSLRPQRCPQWRTAFILDRVPDGHKLWARAWSSRHSANGDRLQEEPSQHRQHASSANCCARVDALISCEQPSFHMQHPNFGIEIPWIRSGTNKQKSLSQVS